MADSWEQIDDDGVLIDWTSVDTVLLHDLWHPFEALRRAINERQNAAMITQTAEVKRLDGLYETATTLHAAISALLPHYAQHTDYNGQWDEKATIPVWTDELLLAEIGDEERLVPARLETIGAWLVQAYKIVNLLRWRKIGASTDCSFREGRESDSDRALAVGLAIGYWNASSWYDGTGTTKQSFRIAGGGAYAYSVNIGNIRSYFSCSKTTDFHCVADAYLFATAGGQTFKSTDGYTENAHNLIEQWTADNDDASLATTNLVFETMQDTPPGTGWWICEGTGVFILRYDINDGFQFRNWLIPL